MSFPTWIDELSYVDWGGSSQPPAIDSRAIADDDLLWACILELQGTPPTPNARQQGWDILHGVRKAFDLGQLEAVDRVHCVTEICKSQVLDSISTVARKPNVTA